MDSEETAVLELINQYRVANGVGALSLNGTLTGVAQWKSQDMAANDYFSHTDSLGRDPFVMMNAFGYTYNTWKGENLAAGVSSAQASFDLWQGSPGHNANMLNANYTVIGISRAYNEGSTFGWYWTTEFGGQGDPPPPAEPAPAPAVAPPPEPEPAPAPVEVQAPAPVTTPDPATPVPAPATEAVPEPTPAVRAADAGARPPRWWQIAGQVGPWWDRLTVVEGRHSLLRTVSYLAETYLEVKGGSFVTGTDQRDQDLLGGTLSDHLWPVTFS